MGNRIIKCLAYYDAQDSTDNRMNCLAAFTKSSYIFDCFERLGYEVDILSASYAIGKKSAKGTVRKLSEKITLRTLSSLGRGHRLKNIIGRVLFAVNLVFHLLFFVRKGDILWIYHSLGLVRYVKLLKKIKNFKLIIEAEEIYGDVMCNEKIARKERDFFKCADAYIFCNYFLNEGINTEHKPSAVSHGTYKSEEDRNVSFDDGKIHVVYAGTFDPRKGGGLATRAAEFLDENYHVHILGFGNEADTERLLAEIDRVSERSRCKVTYDGCLSGDEYYSFLQKCHIGLSTQKPSEQFNDTSFPSKVLVYMANGLRVVSVNIPAVEKSDVGEYLCFYFEPTPEAIANAIKNIDLKNGYNGRKIIDKLDEKFIKELKRLLEGLD